MRHDTFCTYEQAVKLQELGFDWECYEFWSTTFCTDGDPIIIRQVTHEPKTCVMSNCNSTLERMDSDLITAPTMAVAHRWLREVKGIALNIIAHDGGLYQWEDIYLPNAPEYDGYITPDIKQYDTYEAALSAGITEALKLMSVK